MPREQLTDKQQQILEFIKHRILEKGYPPAVREICQAEGFRQFLNPGVMFFLSFVIFWIIVSIDISCCQKHSADRAAHFPQPSHTSSK